MNSELAVVLLIAALKYLPFIGFAIWAGVMLVRLRRQQAAILNRLESLEALRGRS